MKFLAAQFSRLIDVNVFKVILSIQRLFNLTDYREVILKTFTAHNACRSGNLNLKLVSTTTNGFIFQIIH